MQIPGYSEVEWLDLGAQADIYRARNAQGEIVALKLVRADRLVDEHDVMQRLEREALLLQQIRSNNVVGIRAFVRDPAGAWCLIEMDYLDGEPLHRVMNRLAGRTTPRLTRDSPTVKVPTSEGGVALETVPSQQALDDQTKRQVPANLQTAEHVAWASTRMLGICRGVAELHKRRLVHRDLKPHNVMLVGDREVLIDFGLARSPDMTMMTKTGTAVGTVAYMSPQQLDGKRATESDDAYGLGCTFFHLLTGWPPVDDGVKSLAKVANRRRPPDIRRKNPAVPKALADIVARCLEPDRRDRYGDAGELLEALTAFLDGKPLRTHRSVARFCRHQRDRLLCVAGVLTLGLLGALLLLSFGADQRFNADESARAVLDRAERDPAAARATLQSLPDPRRAAVLMAINRQISDDCETSTRVAEALDFGMLKFRAHPGFRLAIFEANGTATPQALRFHEFVGAEQPRHLVAPKGRAWVLIGSSDPTQWWSPDDPRIVQTLQTVEAADSGDPRSLAGLPLDVPTPPFLTGMAEVPGLAANSPIVRVGRLEADGNLANYYRRWLRERFRAGDVDDRLLRHPAEPPTATASLKAECLGEVLFPSERVVTVSFWEAHRIALFFGCRLPTVNEWLAVASGGLKLELGSENALVRDLVLPTAHPGADRTDSDVCFANTNVTEWTLNQPDVGKLEFCAMPLIVRHKGRTYFTRFGPLQQIGRQTAFEPTGLRLYRTRVHP